MSLNNNFAQLQQEKVIEIEQLLRKYLPVQSGYQKIITEAMEYSLMAGGKRLRPMMMQGSIPAFWRNNESDRTVYGSN